MARKSETGETVSRREMLVALGAWGVAGVAVVGCGEAALDCTYTGGLTLAQISQRENLNYVDRSKDPEKNCANCKFYQAAQNPNACGACQIMPGPVNPIGNCDSWAEIA